MICIMFSVIMLSIIIRGIIVIVIIIIIRQPGQRVPGGPGCTLAIC